jgi:hypothetical protein
MAPTHVEARAGGQPERASELDQSGRLISSKLTQSARLPQDVLSRAEAPRMPAIRVIPVGVRGLAKPLPERANFNVKKRSRRRDWLAQIGSSPDEWLCARSIVTGIRLFGRGLVLNYLTEDTGLSGDDLMAALYGLKNGGHLTWSRRGPIYYFQPKLRATPRN